MKYAIISLFAFYFSACSLFGSLTSSTTILPKDNFVLGDNKHGSFSLELKNVSGFPIEIYQRPLGGMRSEPTVVAPREKIKLQIASNTAVIISNTTNDTATVNLQLNGDTGLSMGYQK